VSAPRDAVTVRRLRAQSRSRVCVCVRARACVRVCVRACVCVCVQNLALTTYALTQVRRGMPRPEAIHTVHLEDNLVGLRARARERERDGIFMYSLIHRERGREGGRE
jgi:hypothetical protein